MGLIRSASVQENSVVRISLRDLEAEAQAILDRARSEGDGIVAEASRRAAEIEATAAEKARSDGFRKGYEEGLVQGQNDGAARSADRMTQLTSALSEAIGRIESSRIELENSAIADLAKLAIGVAERICKRQGLIDPGVLAENLREVMKLVIRREDVRIAIHPSQRAALTELLPRMRIEWTGLGNVALIEDDSIAPGGCRVFAGQGEIDADLQTQLDRIAASIIPDRTEST